jgi:probable lipoprotein NlpC
LTKRTRFFAGFLAVCCVVTAFGCAPKKLRIYESAPVPQVRDDIVEYALTLLGKPYRNGAKGPDAFDCSGFVYHVYGRFEIAVPVSTEGLNTIGYEISRDDIMVGDLVIFKIRREHHVGVMINHLEFIHASKSRGVAIDSLDFVYWKKNFSHFRRIL